MTIFYILGLVATIIGAIGAVPYVIDTYRKKTKPHRFAWTIFLITSVISFASQFSLGARASLILFGGFVLNNLIVLVLSLRKNGGHSDIDIANTVGFVLAILAIILWQTTDSPLLALISIIVAGGIGSTMIALKSYKHPYTETLFMWGMGIPMGILNTLAVGSFDGALLAAPLSGLLFSVMIVSAIILGRKKTALQAK